jgi:hypothetical protein
MNLSEILNSGLTFAKSENGKLKIAGNPQTISDLKAEIIKLKPLVLQWLDEMAKLQPRDAIEKTSQVSEHTPCDYAVEDVKATLEAVVWLEFSLEKTGRNPTLRAKIQDLLSASLDAEHGNNKDEFLSIVFEMKNLLEAVKCEMN